MTHKQGENKAPGQQNRGVHEGLRIQEEHHLPANATHMRQVKRTRGGNPGSGTGEVSQPNVTSRLRDNVTVSPHPRPREQPRMSTVCSLLAPPVVRTVRSRTHLTKQFCGHFLLSHLQSLSTSPPGLAPNPPACPCRGAHGARTPGVSHPDLHRPAAPTSLPKWTQNVPEFTPTPSNAGPAADPDSHFPRVITLPQTLSLLQLTVQVCLTCR